MDGALRCCAKILSISQRPGSKRSLILVNPRCIFAWRWSRYPSTKSFDPTGTLQTVIPCSGSLSDMMVSPLSLLRTPLGMLPLSCSYVSCRKARPMWHLDLEFFILSPTSLSSSASVLLAAKAISGGPTV